MWAGVAASGSPISRWTTSTPAASSARALASTSNADSVPSLPMRSASFMTVYGSRMTIRCSVGARLVVADPLDHVEQGQGGERLGEVVVGPGGQALVAVALLGLGGQHHDHDVAGVGVGLELAADLQAVQPRHHDVEQDQPGGLAPGHLKGLDPVGRLQDLVVVALQGDVHQGPHGRLVVGDQQLHRPLPASSSEVGRVKVNTEPNFSNNCPMSRVLIPIPWSRTLPSTVSPSCPTVTRTSPPPREYLIALPTRLVNICSTLSGSPQTTGRLPGSLVRKACLAAIARNGEAI